MAKSTLVDTRSESMEKTNADIFPAVNFISWSRKLDKTGGNLSFIWGACFDLTKNIKYSVPVTLLWLSWKWILINIAYTIIIL